MPSRLGRSVKTVGEHVTIHLTFRTVAPAAVVLEQVIGAINRHAMPYELTMTGCGTIDLDEAEDV